MTASEIDPYQPFIMYQQCRKQQRGQMIASQWISGIAVSYIGGCISVDTPWLSPKFIAGTMSCGRLGYEAILYTKALRGLASLFWLLIGGVAYVLVINQKGPFGFTPCQPQLEGSALDWTTRSVSCSRLLISAYWPANLLLVGQFQRACIVRPTVLALFEIRGALQSEAPMLLTPYDLERSP